MKKFVISILILAVVAPIVYTNFFQKTDEEKIRDRIEQFEESYGNGDREGCLACFDTKSRNAFNGLDQLGSMFGGSIGLFDFDFGSDTQNALFSLGVAEEDCTIDLDIKSIDFDGENKATVVADLYANSKIYSSDDGEEGTFAMVREKNQWYEFWKNDWYISEEF